MTTTTVTAAQARALTLLHTDSEGQVYTGAEISRPTARALVAAGLVEMESSSHTEHTRPQWGRGRGTRTTVSTRLRMTTAGTAFVEGTLGLAPRVECAAEGCGSLAKTATGFCGLGCERATMDTGR